ncbi:MAG: hypothetical protein KatS3mg044_0923 [Rhodothermaceae bacterium]|nr:MAG: hypothetical protein KatS3mg044_0923 [Rhodothermaceae bacterium]
MLMTHRAAGTWSRYIHRYIALTEFAREKFVEGGLPTDRIVVKPNFVHPDPGWREQPGRYALYVGRLSPEKGIRALLEAWRLLDGAFPLKIVGDGPLSPLVAEAAGQIENVEYLGRKTPEEVRQLMCKAAFLVFPSEWYEGFPMVLAEAFGCGLPVVATALGSQGTIVEHGRTGLHFRPGDPEDLAARVEWLLAHPGELARMRRAARAEYEAKYTAERNYEMLMAIYEQAIAQKAKNS